MLLDDEELAAEIELMTDWYTDLIAARAVAESSAGGSTFVNQLSRLVFDPERFPDEREVMNQVGMGAVYVSTSDGRPLRHLDPDGRQLIIERWFEPYATALADEVDRVLDRLGRCIVLDVHSYPLGPLPYELAPTAARPEICLGTDEFHTPPWLVEAARAVFDARGYDIDLNVPFAGTYVPTRHYRVDHRVTSLMIEIRRDVYRTAEGRPDETRLASLVGGLADLIDIAASAQD
jgi:N-formylglutamate amidohydrolase